VAGRTAELDVLAAGAGAGGRVGERALRELLALPVERLAFLHDRKLAGDYPSSGPTATRQRCKPRVARDDDEPALRNLAPDLTGWEG